MKPHSSAANNMVYKLSPLFRAVSSAKRKKQLMLHSQYGTSSKPTTNNLPSKMGIFDYMKNSSQAVDSYLPVLWKTAAVATSIFSNIISRFSKSNPDTPKEADHEAIKGEDKSENKRTLTGIHSNKQSSGDNISVPVKLAVPASSPELKKLDSPQKSEDRELEQTFFEWLAGSDTSSKRKEFLEKDDKNIEKIKKPLISKSSLHHRSRFLVSSLSDASSSGSQLLRLEEVCKHLLLHPEQKTIMCNAGLIRSVLPLKYDMTNASVQAQAKSALSLVGYHDPPRGEGIRILSIDGGGTRAIMAIEILRQLEAATNQRVHELFDYVCGVSSGAVLCLLLGGLRLTLDECESLYRKLSDDIFNQSSFWGTSNLMWNHAYYDTTVWVKVLKKTFGEKLLIDTAKDNESPKMAAISAVMNLPHLQAFVFRNYDFGPRVQSYYRGSTQYRMWEAIRASGAAPGYFEEFCLDDYLHQDGGILVNNPTALAIHEAKLLWPSEHIQCVMSLGCGRYIPATSKNFTSTSLKTKVLKVIDSATDTEAVHVSLNDLLSPHTYFRINPHLTEFLTLDETRTEKLDQLQGDARMYLRKNQYKFQYAAQKLCLRRGYLKQAKDWLSVRKDFIM